MQQQTNREIRVGLFSLGALILLVAGWAWLKSFSLFHAPQRFNAEFDDIAGMSNSATVNVQGVRVGTVDTINFNKARKVLVRIKITNPDVTIPKGSDISIQTLGLVGAKYLEISLPRDKNGKLADNPPLTEEDTVYPKGEAPNEQLAQNGLVHNPTRTELIINNVAEKIGAIAQTIDPESVGQSINNLSSASNKLNANMDRLRDAADSVKTASSNIAVTSERFGRTADNASVASERASTFFRDGDTAVRNISELTTEFKGTSRRINGMLANPNFSSDLKETISQARQTAETVRGAMKDLGTTLQDKNLREQVLATLTRLQQSTENIKTSMEIVNRMSADQGLRSDLKDVVKGAKEALEKANGLLSEQGGLGGTDVRSTVARVKTAATDVDIASRQIQQVLSKRAPLLHLLFGRPGKLPPEVPPAKPQAPLPTATPAATTIPPATSAPTP